MILHYWTMAIGLFFFLLLDYRDIEYRICRPRSIGLADIGLAKNYRVPTSARMYYYSFNYTVMQKACSVAANR